MLHNEQETEGKSGIKPISNRQVISESLKEISR